MTGHVGAVSFPNIGNLQSTLHRGIVSYDVHCEAKADHCDAQKVVSQDLSETQLDGTSQ